MTKTSNGDPNIYQSSAPLSGSGTVWINTTTGGYHINHEGLNWGDTTSYPAYKYVDYTDQEMIDFMKETLCNVYGIEIPIFDEAKTEEYNRYLEALQKDLPENLKCLVDYVRWIIEAQEKIQPKISGEGYYAYDEAVTYPNGKLSGTYMSNGTSTSSNDPQHELDFNYSTLTGVLNDDIDYNNKSK